MTRKSSLFLAVLILLMGIAVVTPMEALSSEAATGELPLRLSEPVAAVTADLEHFIPHTMREQNIPGVAVALIRDGEVVWTEGFGVTNTLTRQAVTADTVFEVASNSKVATAYIALRLVDQGVLALDEPLNDYLPEPWLPPSEYRELITLRHVLSHSSGLGHSPTSRESLFAPGRGYSYSAVGYSYLQAVIEQVTGQSIEELAQELVYAPLGMSSSSYINSGELTSRTSNGHIHALIPTVLFALLYLAALIIVGVIGLLISRLRTGRWRPGRQMTIAVLAGAYMLAIGAAFFLLGESGLPEFAWLIAFSGLALIAAFALIFLAGRFIIARLVPTRSRLRSLTTAVWGVLVLAGLIFLAGNLSNVPDPKWPQIEPQAAGSMRATAGDMAAFLLELADPQHLYPETAAQLGQPQVKLAGDLSWGLGPGIQHSQAGDALWQWGQHIDFQSIMIIYPELGSGVVVLTNNDLLTPDIAVDIAHRALGGEIDPIRRAVHLEYNYREGET